MSPHSEPARQRRHIRANVMDTIGSLQITSIDREKAALLVVPSVPGCASGADLCPPRCSGGEGNTMGSTGGSLHTPAPTAVPKKPVRSPKRRSRQCSAAHLNHHDRISLDPKRPSRGSGVQEAGRAEKRQKGRLAGSGCWSYRAPGPVFHALDRAFRLYPGEASPQRAASKTIRQACARHRDRSRQCRECHGLPPLRGAECPYLFQAIALQPIHSRPALRLQDLLGLRVHAERGLQEST